MKGAYDILYNLLVWYINLPYLSEHVHSTSLEDAAEDSGVVSRNLLEGGLTGDEVLYNEAHDGNHSQPKSKKITANPREALKEATGKDKSQRTENLIWNS